MAKSKKPKLSGISGSRTTTRTVTPKGKTDNRTTLGGFRKKKP